MKRIARQKNLQTEAGFTLMEIVVATTIFAIVVSALMGLFDYTLKINRKAEALRQATQGMRNFVEFVAKEVRNGRIDYSVGSDANHTIQAAITPCPAPTPIGAAYNNTQNIYGKSGNSGGADNALGIVTTEGDRECFYLADNSGTWIGNNGNAADFSGANLMVKKNNNSAQQLNPPNFTVKNVLFYVRPLKDPYTFPNSPKIQPLVMMQFLFVVKLPSGDTVPIYYQSTVSSDKYDIPSL